MVRLHFSVARLQRGDELKKTGAWQSLELLAAFSRMGEPSITADPNTTTSHKVLSERRASERLTHLNTLYFHTGNYTFILPPSRHLVYSSPLWASHPTVKSALLSAINMFIALDGARRVSLVNSIAAL